MEAKTLHPGREDWERFRDETLDPKRKQEVLDHVLTCEFCSEIWQLILATQASKPELPLRTSERSKEIAARLYRKAFAAQSMALQPFETQRAQTFLLAADGSASQPPDIEHLSEAFCEDPDVVLRIMRNNRSQQTYIQLVSDNPALFSAVLVQSPGLVESLVTDESGRAPIAIPIGTNVAELKWLVKLPEMEFELEPLALLPDPADQSWSTTLEAQHGGRIRLTLMSKGSAKFIRLEILELEDQDDDEPLLASVSIDSQITTRRAGRDSPMLVPIDKLPATMHIRIYR